MYFNILFKFKEFKSLFSIVGIERALCQDVVSSRGKHWTINSKCFKVLLIFQRNLFVVVVC